MSANKRVPASGQLNVERLIELAAQGNKLNETIRDVATHPDKRKRLRTIPGTECVTYLGGISVETLYRRLKKQPNLPQGVEINKRRRDFSLVDLHTLQEAFGLRPIRLPGQQGVVLVICNLKGGVGKTTTTAHLAQYLSLHGYRVCTVDLDAQASLTQLFGLLPHLEVAGAQTIRAIMDGPYLNNEPFGVADDLVSALVESAQNLLSRRGTAGEAATFAQLKDALEKYQAHVRTYGPDGPKEPNPEYQSDLGHYVQSTHWHELDLIPSNLGVYGSEFAIASRIAKKEPGFAFYRVLADHLPTLREKYDAILVDTAPSLSFMNSNAMFAADGLLITLPPAQMDVASASLFFELMADVVGTINNIEEHPKAYDFGGILLTKYMKEDASHKQFAGWVREFYGNLTLTAEMLHTKAVEKLAMSMLTLYEAEPSDYPGDRRTFERAVESSNLVNAEIEAMIRGALNDQIRPVNESDLTQVEAAAVA